MTTWGEDWLKGDTYNMSIGQGFVLSTPLQVANATNAIANGGRLLKPRLAMAISDAEDQTIEPVKPEEIRRLNVDQQHLDLIKTGMRGVLLNDDMKKINVPELKIAGKTGTAEYPGPKDAKGIMPTHGWFTAFAPYDNPQVSRHRLRSAGRWPFQRGADRPGDPQALLQIHSAARDRHSGVPARTSHRHACSREAGGHYDPRSDPTTGCFDPATGCSRPAAGRSYPAVGSDPADGSDSAANRGSGSDGSAGGTHHRPSNCRAHGGAGSADGCPVRWHCPTGACRSGRHGPGQVVAMRGQGPCNRS